MILSRSLAAALLLGIGSATALSQSAPPPSTTPMRVTTDTPEYCETLAERVQRAERVRPDVAPKVQELAAEGHSMCRTGLIRGGLARLRRALLLLRPEQ
jgi:hypothetical protein